MPMGMPMAMPMGMGMPMMGMMGMPMVTPFMAPMAGGMNPLMAMQALQQQEALAAAARAQAAAVLSSSTPASTGKTGQVLPIGATAPAAEPKAEAARPQPASPDVPARGRSTGRETAGRGASAAAGQAAAAAPPAESTPEAVEEVPPCHLHPQKKPNAKCKFCQRAQGRNERARGGSPPSKDKDAEAGGQPAAKSRSQHGESEDYSRRTFNCSPMLKDQIFSSSYFKSLLTINSLEDLIEEIAKYADTLDVYNAGSTVSPSCFICQVYRLFTLPNAEDLGEIQGVVDYPDSAVVRCAGFLYMRFVVPPALLWDKMEEYLFDTMPLQAADGGRQIFSTIGDYVEGLLFRDKYFGTPLPRIPMKVRQMLERELAPLSQYRKRMEANLKILPNGRRIPNTPVEVYLDGEWMDGVAKEFCGRSSLRRRVRVQLEKGESVSVHVGKLVFRDPPSEEKDKEGSGAESGEEGGRRRRRSRSPRRRAGSPDWSRYKGRGEAELIQELRERAKEEAVVGVGQVYARRPLTVEEELWKREPETRVSMLGDEHRGSGAHRRAPHERDSKEESEAERKRRMEEEEERKRLQRSIMEKYGATSQASNAAKAAAAAAAASGPGSSYRDVDEPDVLRLG